MKLSYARRWANRQRKEWLKVVDRCEIAGSVRREKPEVKDVEFVVIPKADNVLIAQGIIPEALSSVNLFHRHVIDHDLCSTFYPIKPGSPDVETRWHDPEPDGRYWRFRCVEHLLEREEPLRFNVDIFLVTPDSWGLQFLIRTGSGTYNGDPHKGFSASMLARYKQVMGIPKDQKGAIGGMLVDADSHPIPTPEEQTVFDICRVRYIPPHLRESGAIIQTYSVKAKPL